MIDGLEGCWLSKEYKKIASEVQNVIADGHSAAKVLSQLHLRLLRNEHLSPLQKAKVAEVFGDMDKCLTDGADEQLQLLSMMTRVSSIAA